MAKIRDGKAARRFRARGGGRQIAGLVTPQQRAARLAFASATEYLLSGDSTRDNAYNEGIAYYTRMLGKASITLIDNAASGQSGLDWVNETDVPNKATAIAAITGTGSGTIWEFSYGINDVDGAGDAIVGHPGTAASDIVTTFKSGIDAVITAKPDITLVLCEPVPVAASARNATLKEVYRLLAIEYPDAHLVEMQDHMAAVYDNVTPNQYGTTNVFYFDGTHPDNIGTIRVANKVFNDIADNASIALMQLDNEHWTGTAEDILLSLDNTDIRTNGFWSTSAGTFSSNANWACWPILDIANGNRVRTFHNGNRDEIVYSDSGTGADNTGCNFRSVDTVPDDGALPNQYTHNVVDAGAERAGLNIHSDGRAIVGDETLEVYNIIPGQGTGDLTQADINIGLARNRLRAPSTLGTNQL